ncbi:MAG: hypothetical protein ACHQFZ_04580 [Acidimicrobiales bacterium]
MAYPVGAAGSKLTDSKYGFSFSIPPGWQKIPLTGGDISGLLDLLTKSDPTMKGALTNEVKQAAKQGIKDFAFGPISHNFASNINVIVEAASGPSSGSSYFDQAGVEVKISLTGFGMTNVKTSTVDLPFGKELQATYSLPKTLAPQWAYGLQLYLRHKLHLYIVTFSSSTLSRDRSTALQAERSWRWS